ncbi:hypothetical protein D3C77_731800 [compost metagenome]|nr:Uncharacterised protein [Serratia fonticola]
MVPRQPDTGRGQTGDAIGKVPVCRLGMVLRQIAGCHDQVALTLLRDHRIQHRVIAGIGIYAKQGLMLASKQVGISYL